ncbi:MAG: hypothetical protein H6695_00475 [Deferribacteres bacterium]|nr:hypothetical protein [candidate division KSB1 bacterium]MCB9508624.1 hypothetical protein [Deferribacteres bacterium]
MATITDVRLNVQKGGPGGSNSRRNVTVSYEVCFNRCELLDGTVFVERIDLKGDDPIFDDQQAVLSNGLCIKATEQCIKRKITRGVSRSTLDEDGDTVIFGIPINEDQDELYAKITLTPFTPHGDEAKSNVVRGSWGALGSD